MSKSYVKDIFLEQWDDYQLASISFEYGSNKRFFDFIKEYDIQGLTVDQKYKHKAAQYYMRMHLARLDGVEFKEMPPAKDWSERLERAKTGIKSFASK
jgi:hypothetical protein